MKIVFVSYNNQPGYDSPERWLEKIKTSAMLMEALAAYCSVSCIKLINHEGRFVQNGVEHLFLRSGHKKPLFPGHINNAVKHLHPDIVILSGIRSPLQVMQLKQQLGRAAKIIGRHHADAPPAGFRRILQRLADKSFDLYLFTSYGNAKEWMEAGIIRDKEKIKELTEASTDFLRLDKTKSRQITGMDNSTNFIWVGRLNANKDPLTVLDGFERYITNQPGAKLHMIFHEGDMLTEIEQKIGRSELLKRSVVLKGPIPHNELPAWYSAADFYISGSHSEGGSYALLEAMACGCIPIITAIPAALKMTGDGKHGIVFQPGDANDLAEKLGGLSLMAREEFSASVENYFRQELSTTAIAEKLYSYCRDLMIE